MKNKISTEAFKLKKLIEIKNDMTALEYGLILDLQGTENEIVEQVMGLYNEMRRKGQK
jgi:hypothetical protein